jgi:hypothetical protein
MAFIDDKNRTIWDERDFRPWGSEELATHSERQRSIKTG